MLEFDSLLQKRDHAICSMMQQLQDLQGKAATILHASCASPWSINILIQTHDAQVCPAKQCGRSPVWQKLRMPPASALAHRLAVICQARACCPQRHCRCPQRIWKMSCRLGNRPKHPVPDTGHANLGAQTSWIRGVCSTKLAPHPAGGVYHCWHRCRHNSDASAARG